MQSAASFHPWREYSAVLRSGRHAQNLLRTGDQSLVRQINLSVIMHQLRKNAPVSRAALAQTTGLNKTTVSSLVHELIQRKFVREVGYESPGRGAGRLAMLLTLNPDAGYIVSAEIGVDCISVICTNFTPEIVWRSQVNINGTMSQRVMLDHALALLHQAVEEGEKTAGRLLGLAVGVPGLVDLNSGILLFAPNPGWKNIPLRSILEEEFHCLVFVENEASMAALGEHYYGAAQGFEEVLYISAGIGVGGGLIHNGHVYRGTSGVAGEVGHMVFNPEGELCSCGSRGCWETEVSQRALFRTIEQALEEGRSSQAAEPAGGDLQNLSLPLVVQAARSGDAVCLEALEKTGRLLGKGAASLVNALNPELVILGGPLSLAGEFLLPLIEEELDRCALPWPRMATRAVKAQHGLDACVLGGVAMVYQAILADPDIIQQYVEPALTAPEEASLENGRPERGGGETEARASRQEDFHSRT